MATMFSRAIDPATGETMPFLTAREGSEFLSFRPTPEARTAAVAAVSSRLLDALTDALALTGGDPA